MGKKMMLTGVRATAEGARLAKVEVVSTYPIRPYTGIMQELTKMVANGVLDAEIVHAEGEHAQLSIAYGASAAGARAFTGSSGVGVTYAMELYSPISGERLPVHMAIADRTLDPPGDFGSEHTDAMSIRDQGWLMGWASTQQEALDNVLLFYRIGEDPRVLLPQIGAQDGYFVSHILGEVDVPEQSQVDEFLPPFNPEWRLDPQHPVAFGPQIEASMGPAIQIQRRLAMEEARKVFREVYDDFARIFGRRYDPFLEPYKVDDAEVVFFMQGAHAETAKAVVDRMRNLGDKVGVLRLRTVRPFPTEEIRAALSGAKVVAAVDNSVSFGISAGGGPLLTELRAALYGLGDKIKTLGFVAGLGGHEITHEEFYRMAGKMFEVAKTGRVEKESYWLPFDLE